jgi:hypothetical protein
VLALWSEFNMEVKTVWSRALGRLGVHVNALSRYHRVSVRGDASCIAAQLK